MGARVLRTHVDDHGLVIVVFVVAGAGCVLGSFGLAHAQHCAHFAKQFFGGELTARAQLLGAFAGLVQQACLSFVDHCHALVSSARGAFCT
ncbi:unannotated protein [freshwater metagenome]|uniref:Unannotated protein n=1 Tax=freshwater metagenome TaxID=449393 RepID=A0A6J6X3K0_9ZZZZ